MAVHFATGARPSVARAIARLHTGADARFRDVASPFTVGKIGTSPMGRCASYYRSYLVKGRADKPCSALSMPLGSRPSRTLFPSQTLLWFSARPRRFLSELPERRKSSTLNDTKSAGEQQPTDGKATTSKEQIPAIPIIDRSLQAARERTRIVSDKVRASLTNITPHENIYNLPNFLTITRLIAAPTTAYLLLHDHNQWALALFAYAGITDLIDGWLARKWKLQTVAGSVIDPMADKTLMIILTVTLAIKGALPAYLATLILGRDACLALAAIYYRYASLPAPKTFLRYWDFSLPSAEVHPTAVSKYNTFLQLILIGSTLALPVVFSSATAFSFWPALASPGNQVLVHNAVTYFQYVVALTTLWSGMSYAFLKDAVTILGNNEALKAKQGARGRGIIGVTFGAVIATAGWFALNYDDEEIEAVSPLPQSDQKEDRRE